MPDHFCVPKASRLRLHNFNLHTFNNSIAAMLVHMLAVTLSLR